MIYVVLPFLTEESAKHALERSGFIGRLVSAEEAPAVQEAYRAAISRDIKEDE